MKTSRRVQAVLVPALATICVSLILVSPHMNAALVLLKREEPEGSRDDDATTVSFPNVRH